MSELPKEWLDLIFNHLQQLYGSKFQGTRELWSKSLADLTSQQIKHGLAWLIKHAKSPPPTIGEFDSICRKAYRQH